MSNRIHKVRNRYLHKVPTAHGDSCKGCHYEDMHKDCYDIFNKIGCFKHIFKEVSKDEYDLQREKGKGET